MKSSVYQKAPTVGRSKRPRPLVSKRRRFISKYYLTGIATTESILLTWHSLDKLTDVNAFKLATAIEANYECLVVTSCGHPNGTTVNYSLTKTTTPVKLDDNVIDELVSSGIESNLHDLGKYDSVKHVVYLCNTSTIGSVLERLNPELATMLDELRLTSPSMVLTA